MKATSILAGFAMLVAATGPAAATDTATSRTSTSAEERAQAGGAALPAIPEAPTPFELSDAELERGTKQFAAEVALVLTTYDPQETLEEIARRLPERSNPEAVSTAIQSLHHPGSWSRGSIVYPQLGGLLPEQLSVMVVVEQQIGTPTGIRTETRTLDIRVGRDEVGWFFEGLASHGGEPVPRPDTLGPEARAVLDHAHIELPDSARWDIHAGRVAPELLALMARAADEVPFGVLVFDSGHPWNIFGTDRMSDHTRGVAVDIHRIGQQLVIDDRVEGGVTHRFVQWLYEQPDLANIGSPWALDGFGGRSFTDLLHQDHLHVAVSRAHAVRER